MAKNTTLKLIAFLVLAGSLLGQSPNQIPFQQADGTGKLKTKYLPQNSKDFITQLGIPLDISAYGADPTASASVNTSAINAALAVGGYITASKVGTYQINGSLILKSNTTLVFAPGSTIQKTGDPDSYMHVFVNEAAYTFDPSDRDSNIRIYGNGLNISVNGFDSRTSPAQYGLNGQVQFYKVDDLVVDGLHCYDLEALIYFSHFVSCSRTSVTYFHITGNPADNPKDGIHFNASDGIYIGNCYTATYDDGIALNSMEYPVASPILGDVKNVIIDNCHHDQITGQIGSAVRLLNGSWLAWSNGNSYQHGDTVVNGGRIYRVLSTGPTVAANAPVQTSGNVTGADGITWRYIQDGTFTNVDVRNVVVTNLLYTGNGPSAFNFDTGYGAPSRGTYPGTLGNSTITDLVIQGLDWRPTTTVTKQALRWSTAVGTVIVRDSTINLAGTNRFVRAEQCDVDSLILDNCQITSSSTYFTLPDDTTSIFRNFTMSNSKFTGTDGNFQFAWSRGASQFNNIYLSNSHLKDLTMVIYNQASTSTTVTATGCVFESCFTVATVPNFTGINFKFLGSACIFTEPSTYLFRNNNAGSTMSVSLGGCIMDGVTPGKIFGTNVTSIGSYADTAGELVTRTNFTGSGNLTVTGTNNILPNQTLTGTSSIITQKLGDARYLAISGTTGLASLAGTNGFTGTNNFTGPLQVSGTTINPSNYVQLVGTGSIGVPGNSATITFQPTGTNTNITINHIGKGTGGAQLGSVDGDSSIYINNNATGINFGSEQIILANSTLFKLNDLSGADSVDVQNRVLYGNWTGSGNFTVTGTTATQVITVSGTAAPPSNTVTPAGYISIGGSKRVPYYE